MADDRQNRPTRFSALFDETKFVRNLDAVRRGNLSFYHLFDTVMIFLLSLLFLSTLFSSYARSMQLVYVTFLLITAGELVWLHFNRSHTAKWLAPLSYLGIAKAYAFCLLSSVFYNANAPAITYYVFLILIPVCFTLRVRIMLLIQSLAAAVFCLCTVLVKPADLAFSDSMNCIIFTIIGIIMAMQSTRMRVDNYDMYRETALLKQRDDGIFDNTPCGILELVFTGQQVAVHFANKAAIAMFGYTAAAFWAKTDWDFSTVVHPEDVPLVLSSLQDPVPGRVNTYDFRLWRESEQRYHWLSCTFLLTKVEGDRITTLTNFLDVDEKKRAESASEAKSRFLSRVSHEIRTPINAILGMAELQRQELAAPAPDLAALRDYADETTDASQYLLTLVNDILDTSRIENNKIELHTEVVDVGLALRSVMGLVRPLAEAKKVQFTCERKTHLHDTYLADGVRVQQILINVLNNAVKFTPEGGSVTLTAEATAETAEATTVTFTVRDTGIGMTEEFQQRLFKPFAQENAGNTSPFAGTGLGLNIARALAQKMGGDITCQSTQGVGTTFTITIVVGNTLQKAAAPAPAQPKQPTNYDFTGLRVLLCEDHPLNQKITKTLLERRHCTVEIAADGAAGLEAFRSHPAGYYALILMDIRMPVLDGLGATAAIRALPAPDAATVPIIAMSANAFTEDVKKSLAAGMNAHLAKPVDATLLYNTVARFTGTGSTAIARPVVLVVDDIEMNTAVIANILKQDYDVLTAADGAEALRSLEAHPGVIAVITDIQMPNMDGMQLVQKIRSDYRYDHVAILANTQYGSSKEQGDRLLALGCDDFVYKASAPSVLANRLRNVIARYKTAEVQARAPGP